MDMEYMSERLYCSYEDKLECINLIENILYLQNIVYKYGLIFMENEIKNVDTHRLLKLGIKMVAKGEDINTLKSTLENYIFTSDCNGKEFVQNIIAFKGVLAIYYGFNCYLTMDLLFSVLGIEFESEYQKFYNKYNIEKKVTDDDIYKKFENQTTLTPNTTYLEKYDNLEDIFVQLAIADLDRFNLWLALYGASGKIKNIFIQKFTQNQKRLFSMYTENTSTKCYTETDVIMAQKQVCHFLDKMIKRDYDIDGPCVASLMIRKGSV